MVAILSQSSSSIAILKQGMLCSVILMSRPCCSLDAECYALRTGSPEGCVGKREPSHEELVDPPLCCLLYLKRLQKSESLSSPSKQEAISLSTQRCEPRTVVQSMSS